MMHPATACRSLLTSWSMKFVAVAITVAVLALFSASTRTKRASSIAINVSPAGDTLAITGATLIDGSGHAPVKDSVVIIKGDSIFAVGQRGQIKVPQDAKVIDARGFVLAPGFIDTHNHSD